MAFKLAIVSRVEKGEFTYKQAQKHYGIQGRSTVLVWLRKYGNLDWSKPAIHTMLQSKETPAEKIKRLEKELADEKLKTKVLNMMIDISDSSTARKSEKSLRPNSQTTLGKRIEFIQNLQIVWDKQTSYLPAAPKGLYSGKRIGESNTIRRANPF